MKLKNSQLKENKQIAGYVFAILATIIWSGNFIVARDLNDAMSPLGIAFWRWTVAVMVLLPFALKSFLREWTLVKKHPLYVLITSFLGVTLFNTLIYFAAHTTTAVNLSLICITFPIFVITLSRVFLGEPISIKKSAGTVLVIVGVLYLITKGKMSNLIDIRFAVGDIWMVLAALTFAVYSILIKQKPAGLSIWGFQFTTFLVGWLLLLPIYLGDLLTSPAVSINQSLIISILYIGIFASLTAYGLWSKAIVVIGPVKSGMIYYTLPIFSGTLAHFFLQEKIGWIHILSLGLILFGILIANHKSVAGEVIVKDKYKHEGHQSKPN